MAKDKTLQATDLDDTIVIRLTRRGRIVGWVSLFVLIGVVAWGLWYPESAPEFFSWPIAQLVITLSAIQTASQLAIDQSKSGLVRIGPEKTRVWRVGGIPTRYASSRVSINQGPDKATLLVDGQPLGRLDLFDFDEVFRKR